MSPETDPVPYLLDALDRASHGDRLALYARAHVSETALGSALEASRPCSVWLALRVDAGPPGHPLPGVAAASARLFVAGGTIADAAALWLSPDALPADDDGLLRLLERYLELAAVAGAAALHVLVNQFAVLCARAGAVARGREHLVALRPALTDAGLWKFASNYLDTLADDEALHASPWVRVAAALAWSTLPLPAADTAAPTVKELITAAVAVHPWPTLERLRAHEHPLAWPLEGFLQSLADKRCCDALVEHPTVVAVLRAAHVNAVRCAPGLEVPPDLLAWARAKLRAGEVKAARLAAWLLHDDGKLGPAAVVPFLARAARRGDLVLLAEHGPDAAFRSLCRDLLDGLGPLPDDLADAVLAIVLRFDENCHFAACSRHLDRLAAALPLMREPVHTMVEKLVRSLQSSADDVAAAEPAWARLVARACGLGVDAAPALDAAIAAAPREPLTLALLELAVARISDLSPPQALRVALLLHIWSGTEFGFHARVFAEAALHAILAAEDGAMLPRAAELVAWLIEHGGARHSLAELLYYRAKVTPLPLHAAGCDRALQDLSQAITLARCSGAGWCEVKASCQWVTVHLALLPPDPQARALALAEAAAVLDAAESAAVAWEMLPELWSERARVLLLGQAPVAAVAAWRRALAHTESDRHLSYRADLLANLAQTLLRCDHPERLAEAEATAREALRCLPADSGPSTTAFVRGILGLVLAESDPVHLGEAIVLLDEALRLPASPLCLTHATGLRLALVVAYRRNRQLAEARHHLGVVLTEPGILDDVDLALDAVGRVLELDDVDSASARAQVERLMRRHAGTPWQPTLDLLRALLTDLRAATHLAHIYLSGEVPRHPLVDDLLRHTIDAGVDTLPHELLERYLVNDHLRPEHIHIYSKILLALGRRGDLRRELEQRLAGTQPPHERATALAFLLETLPADDPARRPTLDELDELLRRTDQPYLRAHLAVQLYAHRDDPADLRCAADHAEAAGATETDVDIWRLRAAIRGAQMNERMAESSPRTVEIAAWFAQDIALPAHDLAEMRLAMVRQLLFPAAFTHPAALELAEEFTRRLVGEEAEDLMRRLAWIRHQQQAPGGLRPVTTGRTRGVTTYFDEAPAWAIDLVVGRSPTPPPSVSSAEARWAVVAASIRPDRAADLLIWIVEQAGDALPGLVDEILAVPVFGPRVAVVPRLCELLAVALERRPAFSLRKLEVVLLQSTREWGDGTAYERSASALLAAAETPEQQVEALFFKGVERLEASHALAAPHGPQILAARQHLSAAVSLAERHATASHLRFSVLVSAGNAHRHGDDADLERALTLYAEAAALAAPSEYEAARLAKVRADALIARGAGTDIRDALASIEQALAIRRSGWLRAETLLTAHQAELADERRPQLVRLRRALARLEEAAEHDDGGLSEPLLKLRLRLLAGILHAVPDDRDALRRLDEFAATDPAIASIVQLLRVRHLFPLDDGDEFDAMLDFAENTRGIATSARHAPLPQAEGEVVSPVMWAKEQLALLPPDAVADRPGRIVARAHLCAYLCETGDVATANAIAAVEAALRAVDALTGPALKAMLLGELSRVFAPDNHATHPLRDFKRAAELCERALTLGPLPEMLVIDLRAYLARATRYRIDGDIRGHLLRAEQLYEQVLADERAAGYHAAASHTAANLAELRAALQRGGTASARRSEIAALRAAIAADAHGGLPIDRAGLARELTQLGSDTPGDEGTVLLAEGAEQFATLPWEHMDPSLFESADNYRTICLAELAVRRGDAAGAVARWRERLARIDRRSAAKPWAMAAHNLADLLLRVGGLDGAREAFALCTEALAIRTPEQGLEHHWETAFQLGQTALALLTEPSAHRPGPRMFELAVEAVRGALSAATALVGGERRFRAGVTLLRLSLHAPGTHQLLALAEHAWTHIDAGRSALIGDARSAPIESTAALAVAASLADRLAEHGLVGVADGCEYVLSGEAAGRVLPWLLRAAGCAQRRLAARMRCPEAVPHPVWMQWLTALQRGDAGAIARAHEQIRLHAPDFLGGEPDLRGLAAWASDRSGASAVVLLPWRAALFAAILDWPAGLRIRIARLSASPPPCDEAELARNIDPAAPGERYTDVWRWAMAHVVAPLRRLVPDDLKHLLWFPAGPLRMLSPGHLWPGVAVSLAADPCLHTWPTALRTRVALIVAEPAARGAAIPDVERLTAALASCAGRIGPTRVRISRGALWGHRLGVEIPGLVDGPADASGLLCEIMDSEVVLMMCHGMADGPEDAEIQLVAGDGSPERLTIQQMAADPRRVVGQTFVLLACETGRTGTWLHQAGGLAGALLACGARRVLAPLWPVFVDTAVEVGAAALSAIAEDHDLAAMLAALHATPSTSPDDEISRAGFVLWTS